MLWRCWVSTMSMGSKAAAEFTLLAEKIRKSKALRDSSRPQRSYLAAICPQLDMVRRVLASGDFEECLAIVHANCLSELQLLAKTEAEEKLVLSIMEALEIGEVNYHTLRDFPEFYAKNVAAGFQKKNRLPPDRMIPKDGMHDALTSYEKHVHSRHSPLLAPEERELIRANARLAAGMLVRYIEMQKEALRED